MFEVNFLDQWFDVKVNDMKEKAVEIQLPQCFLCNKPVSESDILHSSGSLAGSPSDTRYESHSLGSTSEISWDLARCLQARPNQLVFHSRFAPLNVTARWLSRLFWTCKRSK